MSNHGKVGSAGRLASFNWHLLDGLALLLLLLDPLDHVLDGILEENNIPSQSD